VTSTLGFSGDMADDRTESWNRGSFRSLEHQLKKNKDLY